MTADSFADDPAAAFLHGFVRHDRWCDRGRKLSGRSGPGLSCGPEEPEDLIADPSQALRR